jgi:hypothetical protein
MVIGTPTLPELRPSETTPDWRQRFERVSQANPGAMAAGGGLCEYEGAAL